MIFHMCMFLYISIIVKPKNVINIKLIDKLTFFYIIIFMYMWYVIGATNTKLNEYK